MAERIPDDADAAVDELRRRARRRLIGAVVLALAAATLVPLLLEKEPKKLGEDVSIQIPPVDEGKFVSRLSVESAPSAAAGAAQKDALTPAPGLAPISPNSKPGPDADKAPSAKAQHAAPAPSANASGTAPALAKANDKSTAGGETASADGFVVQLAAFTDDKGANALANRLKKAGYPAYTEVWQSQRGTLWRVRVGGYPSRADARSVAAKLKAEGHDGLVVAVK